jgi:ArsR family transcriptional regulator, lead/cadmium/zinc/bismuth-responsive transcriptional repressor
MATVAEPRLEDIPRLAGLFRLMGEPSRLRIMTDLTWHGELEMVDFLRRLELSEPSIRSHLRELRARRALVSRLEGRHNVYSLTEGWPDRVKAVLAAIEADPSTA